MSLQWLKKGIGKLLSHACREFHQSDIVGITLKSESFPEKLLRISFREFAKIKPEAIIHVIAFVLQRTAAFFTSDQASR
ncbi:hypothetical protein Zmor_027920 [Zophobas morio]|uniref:Uncharacterized protein n=1 Tax=Zophobas morio TaxID=2755281 RepID=A0AA38HPH4_9CUCU|nr:hypothetical protein Zmor_027920 [Zophobas morio]